MAKSNIETDVLTPEDLEDSTEGSVVTDNTNDVDDTETTTNVDDVIEGNADTENGSEDDADNSANSEDTDAETEESDDTTEHTEDNIVAVRKQVKSTNRLMTVYANASDRAKTHSFVGTYVVTGVVTNGFKQIICNVPGLGKFTGYIKLR